MEGILSIPERLKSYEIPYEDRAVILTMCSLPEDAEIPESIHQRYVQTKIAADRVGMALTAHDLLHIVVSSLNEEIPEVPEISILEAWEQGLVVHGTDVYVTWRGRQNKKAQILGISADKCPVIRLEKEAEERKLQPEQVYLTPKKEN